MPTSTSIADHLPSIAGLLAASRPPPEPVHPSLVQPGYRTLRPKPEQVYKPKNPRGFPNGRLELDIKGRKCIIGREVFMHLQGIEGLPVIPIDVDIIIRRRDSLGDPDAPDCTKVIGWMVGSIIQVGRINSEGWDMHNVCQRVTPNVEAMARQLYNTSGKFVDPAKGSTTQDVVRSLAGDALFIEAMFIRSRYRGYGLSLMAISALIENLPSFHFDNVLLSPVPTDPVVLGRVNDHVFHAKGKGDTESKSDPDAAIAPHTPSEGQSSGTAPVAESQSPTAPSATERMTAKTGASQPMSHSDAGVKVVAGGAGDNPRPGRDDATQRPKRTNEDLVAARSRACKSLITHFERMGFTRWSTETQETARGGIPIWGIRTFHKRPPIHRILPHLYEKPTAANPFVQDDEDNITEEEDLAVKGGWASDPEEDEPPNRSEQEQLDDLGKMMRWTPFRQPDGEGIKGFLAGLGGVEGLDEDLGVDMDPDAMELEDSKIAPTALRWAEALHNHYLKTMGGEPMIPDKDVEALTEQLARFRTSKLSATPKSMPSRKGKDKCTDPEPEPQRPPLRELVEAVKAVRRRPRQLKRDLGVSQKMPDGRALKKKKKKMSGEHELPGLGLDNGAEAGSSGSAT